MHRIEEVSLDFRFEASTRIAQDAAICRAINKTATAENPPLASFIFLPVINDNHSRSRTNTSNIDDRVNDVTNKRCGHRSKLCSSRHVLPSSFLQHSGNAEIDRIVRYRFVHVSKISLIPSMISGCGKKPGANSSSRCISHGGGSTRYPAKRNHLSLSLSPSEMRDYIHRYLSNPPSSG